MNLYLDTEFNGHGGELISIALAAEDEVHFYAEAPEPRVWNGWVYEHVFPHLRHEPEESMEMLRTRLQVYLQDREQCVIYADWPADFAYLCNLMTGPSYDASWMLDAAMVLLRQSEPQPEVPHNALSDAVALMRWHRKTVTVDAGDPAVVWWWHDRRV